MHWGKRLQAGRRAEKLALKGPKLGGLFIRNLEEERLHSILDNDRRTQHDVTVPRMRQQFRPAGRNERARRHATSPNAESRFNDGDLYAIGDGVT